jgi:hypothetical protein
MLQYADAAGKAFVVVQPLGRCDGHWEPLWHNPCGVRCTCTLYSTGVTLGGPQVAPCVAGNYYRSHPITNSTQHGEVLRASFLASAWQGSPATQISDCCHWGCPVDECVWLEQHEEGVLRANAAASATLTEPHPERVTWCTGWLRTVDC